MPQKCHIKTHIHYLYKCVFFFEFPCLVHFHRFSPHVNVAQPTQNLPKNPGMTSGKVPGADPVPGIRQNEGATGWVGAAQRPGRIHQESTLEWC